MDDPLKTRERLLERLSETESLLIKHGEGYWASWIGHGAALVRNQGGLGLEHLLHGFGGTGSFNDVYVCAAHGHRITDPIRAGVS